MSIKSSTLLGITSSLGGLLAEALVPKSVFIRMDALKILKKIEAIDVEYRREAVKRCWKWLQEERSSTAGFAVQAACEYLVTDEKERNALIEKYSDLRTNLLFRNASVKKLRAMEPTRYSEIPVKEM
jgi:hypothetical protein